MVNWRDNPWWNEEQERLRAWDYANLSRAKYDWIWEGKFNDTVENSIIKPEWFDAAIDAHKLDRFNGKWKPYGPIITAFDPKDDGGDAHGLTVRHGSIFTKVMENGINGIDEGCDWATGVAIDNGSDWFVWDGDGMGTGLKRQVALAFDGTKIQYHMFKGSLCGKGQDNAGAMYMPTSDDSDARKTYAQTFKNNRSQYSIDLATRYHNTYRCIIKGEYVDPDEMISIDSDGIESLQKYRAETCRIPLKKNPIGLIQIMSKADMKKLGIDSPNMFDSGMMSLFNPKIDTVVDLQFDSEW